MRKEAQRQGEDRVTLGITLTDYALQQASGVYTLEKQKDTKFQSQKIGMIHDRYISSLLM